jgi:hypothetical protein
VEKRQEGAREAGETGALNRSSPSPSQSSVFSSQVFSEYDPSSATSLLSSAGIRPDPETTRARYYSEGVQTGPDPRDRPWDCWLLLATAMSTLLSATAQLLNWYLMKYMSDILLVRSWLETKVSTRMAPQ